MTPDKETLFGPQYWWFRVFDNEGTVLSTGGSVCWIMKGPSSVLVGPCVG